VFWPPDNVSCIFMIYTTQEVIGSHI
jgi:hypothetical protein